MKSLLLSLLVGATAAITSKDKLHHINPTPVAAESGSGTSHTC